jgi:gas vesicle protein
MIGFLIGGMLGAVLGVMFKDKLVVVFEDVKAKLGL